MTLIAHLSDLHLVERDFRRRDAAGRLRLSFLTFGRSLEAEDRCARLRRALDQYQHSRAEHLVVTGDLTEDGTDEQFELLAEVLLDSGVDPGEVTLTPGNHDAYTDREAFDRALAGPLAPFARTSADGAVTVLDGVAILPVSTAIAQPIGRSAGAIAQDRLTWVAERSEALRAKDRALVLAQHHQPYRHPVPTLNWIDGLQNYAPLMGMLESRCELHVLHGHRHSSSTRALRADEPARVFGADACVENDSPLRMYRACDGRLLPIDEPGVVTGCPVQASPLVAPTTAAG